jgi:hypothetical protein
MIQRIRFLIFAGAVFVAPVLVGSCAKAEPPVSRAKGSPTETPASRTESASRTARHCAHGCREAGRRGFEARVADYAALHQKLETTLPALPDKATPEQIDQHQQALVALITTARKDAKRGDFFTPGMEALARRSLGTLVAGPDGASFKATIMDENPGPLDVSVNDRYPDAAPVSSMPIQLLETLPKLPAELEYRFLGRHLVLVCTPARVILDLTPNVLP